MVSTSQNAAVYILTAVVVGVHLYIAVLNWLKRWVRRREVYALVNARRADLQTVVDLAAPLVQRTLRECDGMPALEAFVVLTIAAACVRDAHDHVGNAVIDVKAADDFDLSFRILRSLPFSMPKGVN